jgi:hypothetical protein
VCRVLGPVPPRHLIRLAALATALSTIGVAQAEEPRRLQVAVSPAPPPRLRIANGHAPERQEMAVLNLEAGTAVIPSRTPGAYGRLWIQYVDVRDRRRPSFAWGFWGGWEGFRADGVWGLAFPMMAYVGLKSPTLLLAVAGGANVFGIGAVDERFGVGLLQPRAHARLGFRVRKLLLSTTGDVQYAYRFGQAAQTVLMTGVSLGVVLDEKAKR